MLRRFCQGGIFVQDDSTICVPLVAVVLRLLNKSASRGESEKAVDSASPIFSQLPDSAQDNAVGTGERQGQLTVVSSIPFAVAEPVNQTLSYAACFRSAFLSGFDIVDHQEEVLERQCSNSGFLSFVLGEPVEDIGEMRLTRFTFVD